MNRDHEPHPHIGRLVVVILVGVAAWAVFGYTLWSLR